MYLFYRKVRSEHCKLYLERVLSDDITKRAIVFHISTKAGTALKEDVGLWLDETGLFLNDAVLITGGIASEIKFEVTSCFTRKYNTQSLL